MQAEAALKELAAEMKDYNEGAGCGVNGNLESGESILNVVPEGIAAVLAAAPSLTDAVCCQRYAAAPRCTRCDAAMTRIHAVAAAHHAPVLVANEAAFLRQDRAALRACVGILDAECDADGREVRS
jgi:hypothetical protein